MLSRLHLTNYRCYESHEVNFTDVTVIVGKNNAGKSTLIEALRLISLVSGKYKTAPYKPAPPWTGLGKIQKGIRLPIGKLEFSFDNIINQYGEPPAIIKGEFSDNSKIEIYINIDGEIFCQIKNQEKKAVTSSAMAKKTNIQILNILPQISPLQVSERVLDKDYVKSNIFSSLSSRHFRNQLTYFFEYFDDFKSLAESSWPKLRIVEFIKAEKSWEDINPKLTVQEDGFSTEIGRMGHGLQMWIQTMWFLARTPSEAIVVLDEPDVYMHADLQRKLIRILKGKYHQVITATHSIEMMAEVDPGNIVVIDRRKPKSILASDFPTIQKVIYNDIGSIHNIKLARLWSSRKILMVEGDDIDFLKKFHDKLFPNSNEPLDSIPSMNIGGWGGWSYAIGSKMTLKNAADEDIRVYCLFDSDYHILPEIESRYAEAQKKGIEIHIWKKKEIENYYLKPAVLSRAIMIKKPSCKITKEQIEHKLIEIANAMRQQIEDDYASEIGSYYRRGNRIIDHLENKEMKYESKNINKLARKIVAKRWHDPISVMPGKKALKELNKWLTENYNVNVGLKEIGNSFTLDEVDYEIKRVLTAIELGTKIGS